MKYVMFIFLLSIFALSVEAQTQKGNFLFSLHNGPNANDLGLSFSSSTSSTNGVLSTSILKEFKVGLNISAHYFVVNRLALGANFNFYRIKSHTEKTPSPNVSISSFWSYGPEVNYFYPISAKTQIRIGQNVAFSNSKLKDIAANSALGLAYFLNPHLSLDLGLRYTYYSRKVIYEAPSTRTEKFTDNNIGIDFGFSAFF
jgi:outer membrane receptor protein involved in Fe transport